ncbi:MAG: hypothetical protein KatS3mg121_0613 [Gammaproteobacteria bacterium]|nr:MAG: hypothetical protein KatS3mg121_0613 [Gammaproteobacteria bacterium]
MNGTAFWRQLGALRILLTVVAWLVALLMLWADPTLPPYGWGLFWGSVLPAAGPVVFMVVCLDLFMIQVFKADAGPRRRARLNRITALHLLSAGLLLLTWLPVFLGALAAAD